MRKSMRYLLMVVCAVALLAFTFRYTYFDIYEKPVLVALSLLGAWLLVATFTLNKTNAALYAVIYIVALSLLLFAREGHGLEAEIGPFLPLDEYFRVHEYVPGFALFNLIGNSVVFAPMGILVARLPVSVRLRLLGLLCVVALVVPLVELLQMYFKVGWFDYYDWIFNAISAVLGFGYACLVCRRVKK